MTTYNERCTIVSNPDGSIKTVFVDQMGIDNAGRHYSIGQATIGNDALTQFLGSSHNTALARITQLETDFTAKTTEYDSIKASLDAKVLELTAKESELVKLAEDHKTVLDAKESVITSQLSDLIEVRTELSQASSTVTEFTNAKTSLESKVSTLTISLEEKINQFQSLQSRFDKLLNELEFNPREISAAAFKARLFSVLQTEDVVRLYAAEADPTLKEIAATILNWDVKYPIRLDSAELLGPLGYLVHVDLLTTDEVKFLCRDCTRSEAHIVQI